MSETEPKKRRVPLWVKILLGVSLALNLAIIGLAAGVVTRLGGRPDGPAGVNYALPYVMALPGDIRREIGSDLRRGSRDGDLPRRGERRAQYQRMIDVLSVEPFDPAAARAVLMAQSDQTLALQSAAHDAWLARVSQMTAEERADYAARLSDILSRRHKRK